MVTTVTTRYALRTDASAAVAQRKERAVPHPSDRPAERPDAPVQPDAPRAPDGRSGRTRDDLHERLRHLPPGHPSSPEFTTAAPGDERLPADIRQRRPDGAAGQRDRESRAPDATRDFDAARRDYWSEVPGFLRTWAAYERTMPPERRASTVDRSKDPPGSWRGNDNQYLDPGQHAQVKDGIAKVQRAEKPITEHMREVEQDNASGGWLDGLEYRLKGEDRLKEKIAEVLKRIPDRSAEATVRTLPDSIRYTFCFEAEK
jgi:hypothetical protein